MRAFIALNVPEEIRARAEELEGDFRMDGITLVKKEAMHLTMQFLGEINAEQAEKAIGAMKAVRQAPFKVTVSGLSYFTPRLIRVIFVGVTEGAAELVELYSKLGGALTAKGVEFEKEDDYRPHITIARVKRVGDMRRLREALEKNAKAELGSFIASSISLKESNLTPRGPIYRQLYELKL
jgi:2'-5' RNA ligase